MARAWCKMLGAVSVMLLGLAFGAVPSASAQDVLTSHNDNSRTGVQPAENTLTPANVNALNFGKVLSFAVDGDVYAQPLYVSQYTMQDGQKHNVLFVATQHDWVYAIDADGNNPSSGYLWRTSLLPTGETYVVYSDMGCEDIFPAMGVTGTPVVDRVGGTLYLVAKSKTSAQQPQFHHRLHALNLVDGTEKLNGPTDIQATLPGLGDGGSTIAFTPLIQNQRSALLLAPTPNGSSAASVFITWASHCDNDRYHGWIIAYNAANIAQQTVAWTDTPDGSEGGIWMSANGMAADGAGNLYAATGNGSFNANTGGRNYGSTALRMNALTTGLAIQDWFTPSDQYGLSSRDADFGVSGPVLLPDQPGPHAHLLVTSDKSGKLYLLNRDNLGHFNGSFNADLQEWTNGAYNIHSNFAFFNNTLYLTPDGGPVEAFSFNPVTGLFGTTPQSQSHTTFGSIGQNSAGSNLTISANGLQTPIAWAVDYKNYGTGPLVLHAYDATNLANELYNSSLAAQNRDAGPIAVKFASPTIANGRVYVGGSNAVVAYGLWKAVQGTVFAPTFSPAPGSYTSAQSVTLSDATSGATIYYTTDGSAPTNASAVYSSPISVTANETINAMATAPGLINSPQAAANYVITTVAPPPPTSVSYGSGFPSGGMQLNGSSTLNGTRLRLTDGNTYEAASAFFTTPLNVQNFTTDFSFQLTNATADGFAFVIQNASGATAIGGYGINLGYGNIPQSVGVKFDFFNNSGEGADSTGIYVNGATPTVPAVDLTSTGINLHSGDIMKVHAVYAAGALSVLITDTTTGATATQQYSINIPAIVGSNTAYVGFTGGTGGAAAIQEITGWTYLPSATSAPPTLPTYPNGFAGSSLSLNGGAAINGTRLRLTDGQNGEARSAFYPTPVNVQQFTSNFTFQNTNANADGFAFVLQRVGPNVLGPSGGGLGYGPGGPNGPGGIPTSMAVKFDLYDNGGEGVDSTGLYFNGASPTTPATNLASSGINLHSADTFAASISYNGTTLTVAITDTVSKASATQSYPVNIPALIGGNSAFAGFTAGTGGLSAIQDILTWTYTAQAGTTPSTALAPTFSLSGGSYTTQQSVSLSDGTPGATIYYTTNGSTPTSASTLYSSAISVTATETISAIATAPGLNNSPVATASYVINRAAVSTPTFWPAGGNYASAQTVMLSDATPGATIYYTTNGAAPTTASTVYSGAISVAATETISAMAVAQNMANSAVAAAGYVISGSTPPPVAILTPAAGQVLSGTVTVTAQITASLDAAGSYLMVDGVEYGTQRVPSPPFVYPLDTTKFSNGSHLLQIWAHNTNNQNLLSASVTVTVTNSGGGGGQPPPPPPTYQTSLTYPANGQAVSGVISVTATITQPLDAAGSYLMVDAAEYGTQRVNPAPFVYPLDTSTLSLGVHTLQVWAHDLNNSVLLSNPVTITVTR